MWHYEMTLALDISYGFILAEEVHMPGFVIRRLERWMINEEEQLLDILKSSREALRVERRSISKGHFIPTLRMFFYSWSLDTDS